MATATPPGEGERRAQRGYSGQYASSAAAIYAELESGNLEWVGLADRDAGIADDVVLGLPDRIVGHQFKTSQFSTKFGLAALLMGANGLWKPLVDAWQSLKKSSQKLPVEIRLVTNDYPSTVDELVAGVGSHSAAFLSELERNPKRSLVDWFSTKWQPFVKKLHVASGLTEPQFEEFLHGFRFLHGAASDFALLHRLSPEGARLAGEIALFLPKLVADKRDKDRWTRSELLRELGWRDSAIVRHVHQFPLGAHVQRNLETEELLRSAIRSASSGYVSLVGPPGAGKSTLLQTSLEAESGLILVRYLAFVPGLGQGVGRGEASDFFDDISTQLRQSGLTGVRFRNENLQERREEFGALLIQAGERFHKQKIRTLIVVDGLDHVPREERPQRSFLAELPLPSAIADGVLFVLGTQRLDLVDIVPAVQDQAGAPDRRVSVMPLRREAVHRMADLQGLESAISRNRIWELSKGHPLVTRYLIEALSDADATGREALLAGAMAFEGDIETVYESAWRGIRDDVEATEVLGYIARSEGAIPLELLTLAVSEKAIERALKSTKHLLSHGPQGWTVFHNSFRLFILEKPRMKFGSVDPTYSSHIYRQLARLANAAPSSTPQRWLELRYLARAQDHAGVLELAQPARFRKQLAEGRAFTELDADIRLGFIAAKSIPDPLVVFRLLLARDELSRRASALEDVPSMTDALLAVGDIDAAQAFIERLSTNRYKVVDALLESGDFKRASELFDKLEPLQQLLKGSAQIHDIHSHRDELSEWAQRVFHFRNADQINQAIERVSNSSSGFANSLPSGQTDAEIAKQLQCEVALAIVAHRPDADAEEVARSFDVSEALPSLLVEAGIRAAAQSKNILAKDVLQRAIAHKEFEGLPNSSRRTVALVFASLGELETALTIFENLRVPSIADLDDQIGDGPTEQIAGALVEHAQLAAMLGKPPVDVPKSKRDILRPLQIHASTIGTLLGTALIGVDIPHGEVARVARAALSYLEQVVPRGSDEHYAIIQISAATPVLGRALIRAAGLCGKDEFAAVLAEFDRAFEETSRKNSGRANLRREVAVEAFRVNGDAAEASRRLEQLVELHVEDTPSMQLEAIADLATSFAMVGNVSRARELLAKIPAETLGYALAPKKDPQYSVWMELFERANAIDPAGRRARIVQVLRQVSGMMSTEGRHSAYRMASSLLIEAALDDAGVALASARSLTEWGTIGWASAVDALLQGLVRRRPDMSSACVVTWCTLALPYLEAPYYREDRLGDFIEVAVSAAQQDVLADLVRTLQSAIEAEARVADRSTLIEILQKAANKRGIAGVGLDAAVVRWKAENPPSRRTNTPMRYDDLNSLTELSGRLEAMPTEDAIGYETTNAFNRLAPGAGFANSKEFFERWPSIVRDSRARFTLVNLAIDEGQPEFARRLLENSQTESDDRATWTAWTGGAKLRYFQAQLRLNEPSARQRGYNDFVDALGSGRESITSVMLEIEDIIPILSETPDWRAMWDLLAEQLSTTREYAIGDVLAIKMLPSNSDETLIAELFKWGMGLPLYELRRHVQIGALRLSNVSVGIFSNFVRLLLAGKQDEPAEALRLLILESSNSCSAEFDDLIVELVDHPDFAVAEQAAVLSNRWGRQAKMAPAELPPFYDFILDVESTDFDQPQLSDPQSGAMLIENPQGWTAPFENLIDALANSGISPGHIRHRSRMFIEGWGGLATFGQPATDRLQTELRRLEMRMTFMKPHVAVALRALRFVAGELRRAGLIDARATQYLLRLMGYQARPLPMVSPSARPLFVVRPKVDEADWGGRGDTWLEGVKDDVRPLAVGSDTVVIEISRFKIRNFRKNYTQERMRSPLAGIKHEGNLQQWFPQLPKAIWVGDFKALDETPATTIGRRLASNYLPETPYYQLTICPHWLRQMHWHVHPENWLIYIDKSGDVVAKIVWWRDGGPVDVDDEATWGEGVYLLLTRAGRTQVEATAGTLAMHVIARRDLKSESGTKDSYASSRD